MNTLTRHRVGEMAGVNITTLLFYERKGLLSEPERTEANYRIYDEDAVRRVRFIKHAQELGFSLKEIKELLSLKASPRSRCGVVRRKAQEKVSDIDRKREALRQMRKALSKLIRECSGTGRTTQCPILDSIDADKLVQITKGKS